MLSDIVQPLDQTIPEPVLPPKCLLPFRGRACVAFLLLGTEITCTVTPTGQNAVLCRFALVRETPTYKIAAGTSHFTQQTLESTSEHGPGIFAHPRRSSSGMDKTDRSRHDKMAR